MGSVRALKEENIIGRIKEKERDLSKFLDRFLHASPENFISFYHLEILMLNKGLEDVVERLESIETKRKELIEEAHEIIKKDTKETTETLQEAKSTLERAAQEFADDITEVGPEKAVGRYSSKVERMYSLLKSVIPQEKISREATEKVNAREIYSEFGKVYSRYIPALPEIAKAVEEGATLHEEDLQARVRTKEGKRYTDSGAEHLPRVAVKTAAGVLDKTEISFSEEAEEKMLSKYEELSPGVFHEMLEIVTSRELPLNKDYRVLGKRLRDKGYEVKDKEAKEGKYAIAELVITWDGVML